MTNNQEISDPSATTATETPGETNSNAMDPKSANNADVASISLPDLAKELAGADASGNSIDLLKDVELNVKIELGRTKMYVEDVLKLSEGSVVELDKLAGDPVDIFVNEKLIARGEVLVLNDNFCVRVNQIVSDIV
ncbi:MAG: flagellar motor switch protein FliN [Phycisphaerae bacterium]